MMKKIGMLVVFVLLLAVATTVQAEIKAGSFSVTPFIGTYIFEGNEYDFRNTYAAGLRAGYNFTKNIGVEGVLSYVPTEIKNMTGNDEVELFGYGIEGLYHFMPESRFVPFLAVGIGEIHYNAPAGDSGNMNKFYIDYGAGLKIFVTDSIALRADVRHVLPTNDNYNDFLGTVGITFAFGGEKKVAEPKLEEPPPPVVILDSDKDGVPDNLDKCPGTPAGVVVDKDGCPVDSDKDGVADYLDKCPGTPAGVVVDKDGCPVDSDKDGVADYLDKCPNTPAGATVDKDGCVHEKISISLNVEFDTNKFDIKKRYHVDIKKVSDFMKAHPETNAVIEGHTDNVGTAESNMKLSQNRAESVRKYLIDKLGIDPATITAVGYGKTRPIAGNDTPEGRQKNRRVEAVIETVQIK